MRIDQYITVPLSHRNYFGIKGNNLAASWIVAGMDGKFSIFDAKGIITRHSFKQPIAGLDYLPQQQLIAWYTDERMVLQTVGGSYMLDRMGKYKAVYFSASHDLLWTIESEDGETALITVLDFTSGSIIASAEAADEYSGSAYSLHPGANENQLVLFMAAGQDGQSVFFLFLKDGQIAITKLKQEDTGPAVFNAGGTVFVQGGQEEMYVYDYPGQLLLQTISLREEYETAHFFGFINDRQVMMAGENIPAVVDIYSCQIEKIIVEGHEPKPVKFYYPAIEDYGELTTDIEGADVLAGYILFHCRNQRAGEQHSILIASVRDLPHNT